MIDDLKILSCDEPDCAATLSGPARRLRALAETAGWQVQAPIYASLDEDELYVRTTDRCPEHPAVEIDPSDPSQVYRSMWG